MNWKIIVVRVLLNGPAIAFTALILPGIVVQPSVLNFLLLGAAVGLLNAFVRPVIQFLTISLLFVTYGLVVILVNTVLLYLLAWTFGDLLVINSLFSAFAGGIIMGLLSLFLENLFGLAPPLIDDTSPPANTIPNNGGNAAGNALLSLPKGRQQ